MEEPRRRQFDPEDQESPAPVAIRFPDTGARYSLRIGAEGRGAAGDAFGLALPERIGAGAEADGRRALCVGPEEWMLWAPAEMAGSIEAAFDALYARIPHSLVEISDREMAIDLEGDAVLDLLAMGCPRDLRTIAVGQGTRTVFDGVPVTLWRSGPSAFRLECWRSYLPHVLELLEAGNRELASGF